MNITEFVTTDDGGSRFVERHIAIANEREGASGFILHTSAAFATRDSCFVTLPADLDQDWHPAPARQLVIIVSGELEVTVSEGETRRWNRGDIFIAGDVTGRGHRTRSVDGEVTVIFLPVDADVFSD